VLALQNKNLTFCSGRRFKMAAATPPNPQKIFLRKNVFFKRSFLEKKLFVPKNFSSKKFFFKKNFFNNYFVHNNFSSKKISF